MSSLCKALGTQLPKDVHPIFLYFFIILISVRFGHCQAWSWGLFRSVAATFHYLFSQEERIATFDVYYQYSEVGTQRYLVYTSIQYTHNIQTYRQLYPIIVNTFQIIQFVFICIRFIKYAFNFDKTAVVLELIRTSLRSIEGRSFVLQRAPYQTSETAALSKQFQ